MTTSEELRSLYRHSLGGPVTVSADLLLRAAQDLERAHGCLLEFRVDDPEGLRPEHAADMQRDVDAGFRELQQFADVIYYGKRLPAPELAQDPAYLAFVLGRLEEGLAGARDACRRMLEAAEYIRRGGCLDHLDCAPDGGEKWRAALRAVSEAANPDKKTGVYAAK